MCYKEELQKKNNKKLQHKFVQDQMPVFIQDYFGFIKSGTGRLTYYGVIKHMLQWLINTKSVTATSLHQISPMHMRQVKSATMRKYLESLEADGLAETTIETRKNMLSSFWKYLSVEKYVSDNVMTYIMDQKLFQADISRENKQKKLPSMDNVQLMMRKIAKKKDIFIRIRNQSIVRVLQGTGLRETELVGLEMRDLHLNEQRPYVTVVGKGHYKESAAEKVYVTKDAKNAFEEWLHYKAENRIDSIAVFINKNGNRLTEKNIKDLFRTYSCGMITPHMMRHLYATLLYAESGHDVALVQEQLRHSSINTTVGTYTASTGYDILSEM